MDDGTGVDLAEPYDAARIAGQKRIQERWQYLTQVTRDTLMASRCYSARGAQIPDAEPASTASEHDAERLEYALGVLALCARASIPARGKVDVGVPREATNSEVLTQCEQLAGVTAWRDPEFLRLGLRALGQHQRAEAFCAVEPSKNSNAALGCVGAILFAGLLLISPCFLAIALVAVSRGDTSSAIAGFYGVGLTAMAILWAKDKEAGKHVSAEERRYLAWTQFQHALGGFPLGAGARERLTAMAGKGVQVPGVAFDLCAALEARI